ncbi:MAG: peptidylprolyl isomerase [Desulfobacterales bacterium]
MKHRIPLIIMFIALYAVCPTSGGGVRAGQTEFDVTIAVVNGAGITKRDFIWALSSEEQRLTSSGKLMSPEELNELKKKVLDHLIDRELLYQESMKKNIVVSDVMVDQEFEKMRDAMISDIDFETIEAELGMDIHHIKNEFRRVFAIETLMARELVIDDSVSEEESRLFYQANPEMFTIRGPVYVSHILIQVESGADAVRKAQAKKKAEDIYKRVLSGDDFAQLAKSYSEGPSAFRGGDIGWIKTGRTVKAFEDAAFALKVGEISGIVETPYGFHIIKVMKKIPDSVFAYDDIREQLDEFLKKEKADTVKNAYVQKLRQGADIDYLMDTVSID